MIPIDLTFSSDLETLAVPIYILADINGYYTEHRCLQCPQVLAVGEIAEEEETDRLEERGNVSITAQ